MTEDNAVTLYEWLAHEFTIEGRANAVNHLAPHLATLVHPGDRVLDLCCGAGAFSFFLEEQGAAVTAIDLAPQMIQTAREAALPRRSAVGFIQADVLAHDLAAAQFDLAVFLGNTVSDFPLNSLVHLAGKISRALRPNGRLAIHYRDGLSQFIRGEYRRADLQQIGPPRITRRFKAYLPEAAAYVEVYRNEATGETCEYTSYLYAPPHLRLAVGDSFQLEKAIDLGPHGLLDTFVKRAGGLATTTSTQSFPGAPP